ncbi:nucleolar protein 14, partial [Kipferlia bialata]
VYLDILKQSKARKATRSAQKEEDMTELDSINAAFQMHVNRLDTADREAGGDKQAHLPQDTATDASYDDAVSAVKGEAKAQPTDEAKDPEKLARQALARLEELEAQRA